MAVTPVSVACSHTCAWRTFLQKHYIVFPMHVRGSVTVDCSCRFDEEDWSDAEHARGWAAYVKSKTLAEKAAWDFVQNLPSSRNLTLS